MRTVTGWFRRSVAVPGDHGSWVFLLSPLLIGLFAGGSWRTVSFYLVVACFASFMVRQPLTLVVKIFSGRRSRTDLPAALFWVGVYSAIGLIHVAGLVLRGYGYVLWLALPGVPVFAWYLYLVSRRAERRQLLVELLATAVLALSATAAFWVGRGRPDPLGWLLWLLTWAQTAASIVYTYLRLRQRELPALPTVAQRLAAGRAALLIAATNLVVAVSLGLVDLVSPWLAAPYLVQWAEVWWGVLDPAIRFKPKAIGFRQFAVSSLFTLLFILAWSG
jgi:hypothetical protein